MKKACLHVMTIPLLFIMALTTSCSGQADSNPASEPTVIPFAHPAPQIAEYIRHIFQDKNGHLWFGTNGYGIAHYNGDSLLYFSNDQGFGGTQITGITEDPENNLWFATDQGVVKHDWTTDENGQIVFTNYTSKDVFQGQRFWSIFADSKGVIWAGTGSGVFRYDGTQWNAFDLPDSDLTKTTGLLSNVTIWSIFEDRQGNIWFGTHGNGAIKYNGASYVQYTEEDGLTDNSVDPVIEDRDGNIWLGTRFGGLSKFDGSTFTNYTQDNSIGNDEVCIVYEDKAGNIWLSSEGYGVYRYDGKTFTNFFTEQGLMVKAVQTIYEDRAGRLWVGGGGGLYRLAGDSFINVTKRGPWTASLPESRD